MSNKYFSTKELVLILIIITVFSDKIEGSVGQPSSNKLFAEKGTDDEESAILLPNKKHVPLFPQINRFLPSLSNNNKSDKLFSEKQINEKHVRTRVIMHLDVDAIYNCTPDSVLSLLVLHSEFDNYFTCNQVLDIPHENKLNATLKRMSRKSGEPLTTPIITFDSSVKLVFFKGNQMYQSTGNVEGGHCSGDQLTILNVSLVRNGSCNLRSGVQQIVSDYAMLNISGKCESMCFGDVNVTISPGLRN